MENQKTLKETIDSLIDELDLGDGMVDSTRDFAAQVLLPAVAAKVVLTNMSDTVDSINERNRDMLGFEMEEKDFLNALYALIPTRIKELEDKSAKISRCIMKGETDRVS